MKCNVTEKNIIPATKPVITNPAKASEGIIQ